MSPEPQDIQRGGGKPCEMGVCTGCRESCKSYSLDPGTAVYITEGSISESTRNNSNQDILLNCKLSSIVEAPISTKTAHFPIGQEKGSGGRGK